MIFLFCLSLCFSMQWHAMHYVHIISSYVHTTYFTAINTLLLSCSLTYSYIDTNLNFHSPNTYFFFCQDIVTPQDRLSSQVTSNGGLDRGSWWFLVIQYLHQIIFWTQDHVSTLYFAPIFDGRIQVSHLRDDMRLFFK